MVKNNVELFSSRWGLVLVGLGMAIGTGNLWRFPRIAAQNGGGAFLLPWLFFLFAWSIPLLIAEFGLGRGSRRGPVGAFATMVGRSATWMGGFIVVTTVMIMFYYSVVTGWTLKYFLVALLGGFANVDPSDYWNDYSSSIWQPAILHVVSIATAGAIVGRGLVSGIERANRVLIPTLFVLLVIAAARSVTLPGASEGLRFLFLPELSALMDFRTWLEALTQSAWSTGAGWGLICSYAVYARRSDNAVSNAITIGLGNNLASLLAAVAILPTAFAILPSSEAREAMAAGNIGLTFVWIPQLFGEVPGGQYFLPVFFLALFFAALSSLIAMVELASRALIDAGLQRSVAVLIAVGVGIVLGLPSAVSLSVFQNQDWVWGFALMISGLFIAVATIQYGVDAFRHDLVNTHSEGRRANRIYSWTLKFLVPIEFIVMFGWWMYQTVTVYEPVEWWNPLRIYSVGSCVVQWSIALVVLRLANRRLSEAHLGPRATLKAN